MRYIIFSILILLGTVSALGKEPKVKTVTVEHDYVLNPKETPAEGRFRAIEEAKIKGIIDEFGSTMSQTNYTQISNETDSRFDSFSQSDANGEWLKTIDEKVTEHHGDGTTVYHVKLKGQIREIVSNRIDLDWAVMANGTDPRRDRVRDERFYVGDYMYIYFMSPVDGYLAVYLSDCGDVDQPTQCLLPYYGSPDGAVRIEANKPYIFFSRDHADAAVTGRLSRIKFNSHNPVDYNRLYILFSPNEFVKVVDRESTAAGTVAYDSRGNAINLMPRQTDFKRFQDWLTKTRLKDPDMQNIGLLLKIEK